MILHAAEVSHSGFQVHIFSQDTDVLLPALYRVPQLGAGAAKILQKGENTEKIFLLPIYDQLGLEKKHLTCLDRV